MNDLVPLFPRPPDWAVDWPGLVTDYPFLADLAGCPQDPIFHAEGDVATHVRMVCEALAALPAWRDLPASDRQTVFAAALLHDVAKPVCTRTEPDGRITSRGHSRRGSIMARRLLWHRAWPFAMREMVAALVRYHQVPYHLLDHGDPARRAAEVSQTARCDLLTILAEADVRGRICRDQNRLLDAVALFAEFCREQDCWTAARRFPSDHSRFLYFRDEKRSADVLAHEDFRTEVVLMSGLPGSGKNHWVTAHLPDWPVVSLDALREELDVKPTDTQGTVLNAARQQAREYLRAGRPFVWNATNLSRLVRNECIRLFADYHARVRIVYVEVSEQRLQLQNRKRAKMVPTRVIERMLDRWEVPDRTEAHEVSYVV
jgi:predicted kinase